MSLFMYLIFGIGVWEIFYVGKICIDEFLKRERRIIGENAWNKMSVSQRLKFRENYENGKYT